MRQIEQVHSVASISSGASTSKRTEPQWQPPFFQLMGTSGIFRVTSGNRPI
ncbi:hypothetical protein [Methyloceanibacter sp.]|uniref:hypothetical protein n=1 Tax=Methyloceanibacter sp. TaxID=1965321 RepID=UPI002D3728AB|nr:hypothetical protein [Methyloceanibacter sp.]HZP09982.1 hypothetical protein [Methyloceanibacter sp.]